MQTAGRLLMGFAVLVVAASIVIVAGSVYLGEGPQGEYRQLQVIPAAGGSQTPTPKP